MKRFPALFQANLVLVSCLPLTVLAQPSAPLPTHPALADASLEDLMNIEVISVSRKEQKLSRTGAAVFVITQDDIRRSGAANIPDVLRMAPGVNVARVDANAWAISIRGFNNRYSNKILVLIDGRSIYSPIFSGVYWDQINVPLEDIERIEIIRGPGGTVWGANAVDGVINIITMSSKATQGGLLVAGAGSQESVSLAQYGGKAGGLGTWRAFGRYSNTESSISPAGGAAADGWHSFSEGFRADLELSPRDKVMVQGDLYRTGEGQTVTTVLSNQLPTVATLNDAISAAGGDFQVRWDRTLQSGSETSLNVYYNYLNRFELGGQVQDSSLDIDFQHHFALNSWNDVVWGLAYRVTSDNLPLGYSTKFTPTKRTVSLYSGFVQDEIKLAESVRFTVGTKLEHNDYTGFEYEPSAQLVWTPSANQTIWTSAARAIRQPSRQDTDLVDDAGITPMPGGAFGVVEIISNSDIHSEQVRDYEIGYRTQLTKRFSLDIATFRSYFSRLETTVPGDPFFMTAPGPPHLVIPLYLEDGARANTYGGEVFATWNVNSRWRLSPSYSLIHMRVIQDPASPGSMAETTPGATPKRQIQMRCAVALRSNLDWDTSLSFIGLLGAGPIPAYTRLDTQIRWRISPSIEAGVTGQNLLSPRHPEFADAYGVDHTLVERSVIGKITWKF